MKCKKCKYSESKVVDSRVQAGDRIRRRECCNCGHRWNTVEVEYDRLIELLFGGNAQ